MTSERGGRPAVPLAFLGGLAVLSGGHIISKVLTFFVFAALARALDRDGYGAVEYLGGLALLFATAVESGLGAVGVRRIARHPGDGAGLAAQILEVDLDAANMTKVLMSEHAYNDPAIRDRLEPKGELILIKPGERILLETANLQLLATVVDMEYGMGSLPANSYFQRVTLEFAVWPRSKNKAG